MKANLRNEKQNHFIKVETVNLSSIATIIIIILNRNLQSLNKKPGFVEPRFKLESRIIFQDKFVFDVRETLKTFVVTERRMNCVQNLTLMFQISVFVMKITGGLHIRASVLGVVDPAVFLYVIDFLAVSLFDLKQSRFTLFQT